jgi:hypothetical protein
MTKFENLQELVSLLNQAQDLIEEIFGDDENYEAYDMSINLSSVISDAENLMEFTDNPNLTINGVSVTIES